MSDMRHVTNRTSQSGSTTSIVLMARSGLVSDEVTEIYNFVNFVVVGTFIATFGVFSNIVNIIVFIKQGFADTVNVSLFALALTDLSSLLTFLWISLLRNPLFFNSGVPLIPTEVFHLTGGWPHGFFARLTSWITAYITLERCLCVLIPLKVKSVVTPKLATIALTSIFLMLFLTLIPEYSTAYLGWKLNPARNISLIGLLFTEGRAQMAVLSFSISAYVQLISYMSVVIFTAILVVKMKQNSKWRASNAAVNSDSLKGSQKRDNKTVSMIILIAGISSVCYVPVIVISLATSFEPELSIVGRYHNTFLMLWSSAFLMDTVNSSANIFVYYRLSSRYRTTCYSLVKRRK